MTGEQERTGVAVVLLSYNRPQMLELAWHSIMEPTRTGQRIDVILVDDGSDAFDVEKWANVRDIRWRVFAPPRSLDQRMTQASLGRLINGALFIAYHRIKAAAVTYLCDDDLFAPSWVNIVESQLRDPNGPHVLRGRWRSFDDPLDGAPMRKPKKTRPTPLDVRKMTTGNFAHRTECYIEGFRWSEATVAVHDDTALWNLNALHPLKDALEARGPNGETILAGYRREHNFNMARYTSHQDYAVGAEEVLKRGALE